MSTSSSALSSPSMRDPEQRQKCFGARDNFFTCYKKDGPELCQSAFQLYNESCPEKWRHFWDEKFKNDMKQFILEQDELAAKPHGIDTRGKITTNPYG